MAQPKDDTARNEMSMRYRAARNAAKDAVTRAVGAMELLQALEAELPADHKVDAQELRANLVTQMSAVIGV